MSVKYKIHGWETIYGKGITSANTNKFYDTFDEAVTAARSCLTRRNSATNAIVITKTIAVVELETPPITIRAIEDTK